MILRCTTKLLKRLDVEPVAVPRPSTTVLGDWYATLLHMRRGQFVLAIARVTLQPVVVTGRDLRGGSIRSPRTLIPSKNPGNGWRPSLLIGWT